MGLRFLALILSTVCLALPSAQAGFKSPSGTIFCYVGHYSDEQDLHLMCMIDDADWPMPPASNDEEECRYDSARMVVLPPAGEAHVLMNCFSDVSWPIPLGTISYGSNWSVFDYSCDMAEDGVRCTNSAGGSFHLNRSVLQLN